VFQAREEGYVATSLAIGETTCHLPARIHFALRLSDDQHPAEGHAHADQRLLLELATVLSQVAHAQRLFRLASASSSRVSLLRRRPLFESFSKNNAIVFKKPVTEGIHIEDVKVVNGSG